MLCLLVTFSCDFGDTNVDPANPTDVSVELLLPTAQVRMAYFIGGDASRYNGMFTQHFGGGGRQHLVIGRNQLEASDVNTAWNQQYAGTLQDLNVILELANAEDADATADQFSGASKVLTAYLITVLSDLYEDIPYSEAFQGIDNVQPAYDTRDAIYASAHTLLSEARAELAVASDIALGGEDLIYGGDTELWIKAAHAIEARLYLHEGRYSDALTSAGSGFTSSADDMEVQFGSAATESNPWFQFEEQRADVVMGKYFIDMLVALDDPRLPFFAMPTNYSDVVAGEAGTYVGAAAGNPVGGESTVSDLAEVLPMAMTCRTCAVPFMTYTEQKFIEAEALLATGNASGAADAANAAMAASIAKVTGAEDAIYQLTNAYSAGDIDLEGIISQKYIALFAQMETWNDWRRTGYPVLQPVSPNNLLTTGDFLLRWPLPQSEQLFNQDNHDSNNVGRAVPTSLNGVQWDGQP